MSKADDYSLLISFVINTVSENMIHAVNTTSINAPFDVSEWDLSGFREAPRKTVQPVRVQESGISVEGKVVDNKEFAEFANPGKTPNVVVFIQATRFWIWEDAVNKELNHIDLEEFRPLAQLGGVTYGTCSLTIN
ncbi:hypothetical protein P170DRAFT_480783 [Aspergillus steynii IBT 23096]|uniref:Uncharacterized protein n=1 Tax=Aspergillus steynii IBT 23096 TaxID=1392250 RepID=A0A2I2FT97_9EURO|nr:uncharacterized protein P170DRAFT_480783 [Aspergillus steynii IBT 23096]PLB43831.1 hypothetical protein P170DRAFT_480783 [Aspergillus steynii IBT 23096]